MTNITLNFYDDNNDHFFRRIFIEISAIKVIEIHLLHGSQVKCTKKHEFIKCESAMVIIISRSMTRNEARWKD